MQKHTSHVYSTTNIASKHLSVRTVMASAIDLHQVKVCFFNSGDCKGVLGGIFPGSNNGSQTAPQY